MLMLLKENVIRRRFGKIQKTAFFLFETSQVRPTHGGGGVRGGRQELSENKGGHSVFDPPSRSFLMANNTADIQYLRQHNIPELVNDLIQQLVTTKPAQPVAFLRDVLSKRKAGV